MKNLVIALLFGFASLAQANVRIGYVDMQKALHTVKAGKAAKDRLEKEVAAKRKQLEKEQASLQKEAEALEKRAAIMNEAARAKEQAKLQKKAFEFQKKFGEMQRGLQVRERELTKPIIDELRAIIEGIGNKRKYQLIVEKNEGAVLFAQAGSDITSEVIKAFDGKKRKKK